MMMWDRAWRYLKALLPGGAEDSEDPDALLSEAQREMTKRHAQNRERAVEAITEKNNLQQMVDSIQVRAGKIVDDIRRAEQRGDAEEVSRLRFEREKYATLLADTRQSLARAERIVEVVKTALRREEEQLRRRNSETLALRDEWQCRILQHQAEQIERGEEPDDIGGASRVAFWGEQARRWWDRTRVGLAAGLSDPDRRRARLDTLAQRESIRRHECRRKRVAQAIEAKDHLLQRVADYQGRAVRLHEKAKIAASGGYPDLERQLRAEEETYLENLTSLESALGRAIDAVERMNEALARDEVLLRRDVPDVDTLLAEIRADAEAEEVRRRQEPKRSLEKPQSLLEAVALGLLAGLFALVAWLTLRRPER